jgi:Exonuclease III
MSGHSSLQSCCTLLIRAVRPTRQERGRNLRPAYWNANSIRSKKLELVQFLLDHGIDICHINETHLMPGQEFRLANYVCHRNDRPTQDGGTMILVRRGIDHYSVPVSNLQQMEATAIYVNIDGRPVKLVAVHLSPQRLLLDADLSECTSTEKPVLLAGDLKAKHKDWNSKRNSPRGILLRGFPYH